MTSQIATTPDSENFASEGLKMNTPTEYPPATSEAPESATEALPEGHLACSGCGVAVAMADQGGSEVSRPVITKTMHQQRQTSDGRVFEVEPVATKVTLCGDCADHRELAHRIVQQLPERWLARRGSSAIVEGQVLSIVQAHAIAGVQLSDAADAAMVSTQTVEQWLRHVLPSLPIIEWADQFEGLHVMGARGYESPEDRKVTSQWRDRAGQCTLTPWGHVERDARARINAGFAELLHARLIQANPSLRKPISMPDPSETIAASSRTVPAMGGCLFCGVATVRPAASSRSDDPEDYWTRKVVSSTALGGRGTAQVVGYLCPTCTRAADRAGSMGQRAIELAVVEALTTPEQRKRIPLGTDFAASGIVAHAVANGHARINAANPPNPTANPARWAHVPNIADLKRDIAEQLDQGIAGVDLSKPLPALYGVVGE